MNLKTVKAKELNANLFRKIDDEWLLICTKDRDNDRINMMTASWGGFGILWNREVCYLFVRPQRHTHKLLTEQDTFSVLVLPEALKHTHKVFGKLSGRDLDKIKETGLTPAEIDGVPAVEEAELIFTVKKLYEDTIKKEGFLEEALLKNYPTDDFHTVYVCEIKNIYVKE
jgi:flavin reductase (DIM6/NTAB) family NADH-FMN oxidoreductase RutF